MSVFCPCVSCVTVHWFVVCVCLRSKNSFNMSQSHIKFVLSFVSQSVMKFVPWIDIFLWQISQTTESQPNYNSLVLCLKIVCPSVCLSVYLVLSQVCVSMSKKWVVLFILWIDHMPNKKNRLISFQWYHFKIFSYLQLPWYQYLVSAGQGIGLHFLRRSIFFGQDLPPGLGLIKISLDFYVKQDYKTLIFIK